MMVAAAASASVVFGQDLPAELRPQLQKILGETGEYCERLKGMALDFFCQEKISEIVREFEKRVGRRAVSEDISDTRIFEDLRIRKTTRNSYLYDYQLVKKGGEYREQRNLLEENGRPRDEKNVLLKTMRFTAEYLVFGPVGFLSRYWQNQFNYSIEGTDRVEGRDTFVISAQPKEIRDDNYYRGRIWVDEKDSSILRIEWEPLAPEATTDKLASLIGNLKRKIIVTGDYALEKNGVRFPSRMTAREIYTTGEGKEHMKYEASYVYSGYKFFTVETEVTIKK